MVLSTIRISTLIRHSLIICIISIVCSIISIVVSIISIVGSTCVVIVVSILG